MKTLFLDIDDVMRNLKDNIISFINIKYPNWDGNYFHDNEHIVSFFKWYRNTGNFSDLFKNSIPNKNMFSLLKYCKNKNLIDNIIFVSYNDDMKAQEFTTDLLHSHLFDYGIDNYVINYVSNVNDKYDFIYQYCTDNNIKHEDCIFVDDMAKQYHIFNTKQKNNKIKMFWLLTYNSDYGIKYYSVLYNINLFNNKYIGYERDLLNLIIEAK